MSRPLRIEYPGAFYHVMSRGNGRQWLYKTSEDLALFIRCLRDVIRKYHVRIHAAVLMMNHYHLLLETPEGNLSSCMRRFNAEFSRSLNERLGRKGSILRQRYKAILVNKNEYYLALLRYIYQNPVRSGIVAKAEYYPGSGLAWFRNSEQKDVICWKELLFPHQGGRDLYSRLLSLIGGPFEPDPYKKRPHPSFLGAIEWIAEINKQLHLTARAPAIGDRILKGAGFDLRKLRKVLKMFIPSQRAAIEIWLRYRYSGSTAGDIRQAMNLKSVFSVRQAVYRMNKRLTFDLVLKRKVEKAVRCLAVMC